jgi:spore coat protein CotH
MIGAPSAGSGQGLFPQTSGDLFNVTSIWTIHLKFTPDQWEAMEPKGGGGMLPGRLRALEGRRGPWAGPGGGGEGGVLGEELPLAPAFMRSGDQDRDGKLSRSEFQALAEKWFAEWDKEKRGQLNGGQVGAGLLSVLSTQLPGLNAPGGPDGRGGAIMIPLRPEGRRNGLAGAAGIQFEYVHAHLEFQNQILKDVAVRYKGNSTFMSSRGSLKRPLKVDLNKYVKGQRLAGVSKLNFRNNVMDVAWMNEVLSYRLYRDAGVPAPRTAYARVYLTVPDKHSREHLGLYSIIEDIDVRFAEERFGSKKGAIFKPVTRDPFAYRGEDWEMYKSTYDPKTELSEKEIRRVIDFARLVTHASDAEFAAKLGDYLDLDEFARFMAVTAWLPTLDSILGPGHNYFVYLHPKTRKFQFLPWDLDHSFGQFGMMGGQSQSENLSIRRPWRGDSRFLERVFQVEAFKKLYLSRLDEFSGTIFQPERVHRLVDEIAVAIRPAVRQEPTPRLARFERLVGDALTEPRRPEDFLIGPGSEAGPRLFGGVGPGQPVKPLKAFIKDRAQSVKDQLAGKTEGQTFAGPAFGGPGGFRGGRRGEPEGLPAPGLANVLARPLMAAMDSDKDGEITRAEFAQGFAHWFEVWDTDQSGFLAGPQLRAGLGRDLLPPLGRLRGGPGPAPSAAPPPRK